MGENNILIFAIIPITLSTPYGKYKISGALNDAFSNGIPLLLPVNYASHYNFPGNVREMKNIVSAAYLSSRGRQIHTADVVRFLQTRDTPAAAVAETADSTLQEEAQPQNAVPFEADKSLESPTLKEYVSQAEKEYLMQVLKRADTVNKACSILKISRPTFYQKLKLYGIKLNSRRLV